MVSRVGRNLPGISKRSRKAFAVSRFEAAADAIVSGDVATLKRLLREDPKLIRAISTREHGATLLHYVSANGVEGYRQKTPKNIVAIAEMLLNAGAEIDATANVYGGGCTTLGLAATSIHPERAGVQEALLQTLLDHGALTVFLRQAVYRGRLPGQRASESRPVSRHPRRASRPGRSRRAGSATSDSLFKTSLRGHPPKSNGTKDSSTHVNTVATALLSSCWKRRRSGNRMRRRSKRTALGRHRRTSAHCQAAAAPQPAA